jgi:hypothetical protein
MCATGSVRVSSLTGGWPACFQHPVYGPAPWETAISLHYYAQPPYAFDR